MQMKYYNQFWYCFRLILFPSIFQISSQRLNNSQKKFFLSIDESHHAQQVILTSSTNTTITSTTINATNQHMSDSVNSMSDVESANADGGGGACESKSCGWRIIAVSDKYEKLLDDSVYASLRKLTLYVVMYVIDVCNDLCRNIDGRSWSLVVEMVLVNKYVNYVLIRISQGCSNTTIW